MARIYYQFQGGWPAEARAWGIGSLFGVHTFWVPDPKGKEFIKAIWYNDWPHLCVFAIGEPYTDLGECASVGAAHDALVRWLEKRGGNNE